MPSTQRAFQNRNAAGEAAAPVHHRSWQEMTRGLEAAARSSVGPAGRPVMLLSTSTASAEPMTVTKVTSLRRRINLSVLVVADGDNHVCWHESKFQLQPQDFPPPPRL